MIRDRLAAAVAAAVAGLRDGADAGTPLAALELPPVEMERPAHKEHGDWSTNVAMRLAKAVGLKPRDLASAIIEQLEEMPEVEWQDIAGPGFINFTLRGSWLTSVARDVQEAGVSWGRIREPDAANINLEFVSANPTGPLHLGHARWAAVGDTLAAVLDAAGHTVEREFYVNDYGRQMDLFGESVAARYLQAFGRDAEIPEGGYQGEYVTQLAQQVKDDEGDRYLDADPAERVRTFREIGRERMLDRQRQILDRFGVRFDTWASETSLHDSGAVDAAIARLRDGGHLYEQDGALWLRTTDFGDDKDRVVVRADGTPTYMAPDVAYYLDKKRRGFDRIIFLWGADHHGYIRRLRAAVRALGDEPADVEFLIGQLVNLKRGGEPVRMSKRTGDFVTFEELIDEVGV
ncbi:MAG: arginine--tRNA ligase, partial [Actinomycetota bacterium]